MNVAVSKKLLSYRKALYKVDELLDDSPSQQCNYDMVFTFAAEMAYMGYSFSDSALKYLKSLSVSSLQVFRSTARQVVEEALGAEKKYVPLFRKFPESIPDRDLLIEAVHEKLDKYSYSLYYVVYGRWSSDEYNGSWFGRRSSDVDFQDPIERPELISHRKLVALDIVDEKVVLELFQNLISTSTSTTVSDKEFIKEVIKRNDSWSSALPESIPNKENLMVVIAYAVEKAGSFNDKLRELFTKFLKTATDVLRLAAAFSDSDVSLEEHTRFKLSNSQRKFLMSMLDKLDCSLALEDILRFRGLWLILAKYLHVNAYVKQYPKATRIIHTIRSDPKSIETFNRTIEKSLTAIRIERDSGNMKTKLEKILNSLKSRPGDFARRLDHLLRISSSPEQDVLLEEFLKVTPSIATPLLLNLSTHFRYRSSKSPIRVYLPKGSATNVIIEDEDKRLALSDEICYQLESGIDATLIKRFKNLDSLGNVYIDPKLEDFIVPIGMRNVSESLQTLARGSKIRFDKCAKVIRLFLYWEKIPECKGQYNSRVDVDLSSLQLGENYENRGEIGYYNLENAGITHSGDITDAPNGAAEFIDIDLEVLRLKHPDIRYLGMTVNSYSGQSFDTFVAKAGFMLRDGDSGNFFEPKTVEQKFDVVSATKFNVPMVLDIKQNAIIWLDVGVYHKQRHSVNLNEKSSEVGPLVKYAVHIYREKCNLLKLLKLHADARATSLSYSLESHKSYDTVFDTNFASKVDEIMGKFLV
ncbi:LANO_0D00144g1_1 [Lachancea nothofagi CBS 11611]|uniref:LANO_0D00144g1_1 n=1 Tax=Lachancea nothofagi CBS 11611 TaxID=1266666 RepID=A0A1G4JD28_9SACH|nr:LANO_0D00144g1_1 [Lachancea nothofagi CBS 11611]